MSQRALFVLIVFVATIVAIWGLSFLGVLPTMTATGITLAIIAILVGNGVMNALLSETDGVGASSTQTMVIRSVMLACLAVYTFGIFWIFKVSEVPAAQMHAQLIR